MCGDSKVAEKWTNRTFLIGQFKEGKSWKYSEDFQVEEEGCLSSGGPLDELGLGRAEKGHC